MDSYEIPDGTKVLIATPNYTNTFESTVHANHVGCVSAWTKWGIDFNWTIIGRSFVHFARTQMCQAAVSGGFTHILWLDDDAIIDSEILPRFLQHDKDVMIAPYCMRRSPHQIGVLRSTTGDYHDHSSYDNLTLKDMDKGLVEVDGGGTHCMLVKVSTLLLKGDAEETLQEEHGKMLSFQEEDSIGFAYFMMPKAGTEDMYWCYRAKKKGIEIWCDTDVFAGHVGYAPVVSKGWREYVEGIGEEVVKGMQLIPGADVRNHSAIIQESASNLI